MSSIFYYTDTHQVHFDPDGEPFALQINDAFRHEWVVTLQQANPLQGMNTDQMWAAAERHDVVTEFFNYFPLEAWSYNDTSRRYVASPINHLQPHSHLAIYLTNYGSATQVSVRIAATDCVFSLSAPHTKQSASPRYAPAKVKTRSVWDRLKV